MKKLSSTQLEEILKETPKHILDRIANVMLAFLLKANVPLPEAEELVGKVSEKKMGELFANVKVETGVRLFIENCQEFHLSEADTLKRLIEKFELSREAAEKKLNEYWKK